jgi:hypothetical protein
MGDDSDIIETDVDELWVREWVEEAIAKLEQYLERHAEFADFLRRREEK